MDVSEITQKKFTTLLEKDGGFYVTKNRYFRAAIDINEYTKDVVKWAFSQKHFKSNGRDNQSIIKNAIIGKFGEFGPYKYLKGLGYDLPLPELLTRGYGEWDDGDIFLEGKKISVKTSSHVSNILLLKKNDWGNLGNYLFGKNGLDDEYKAFFLCRVKPFINDVIPEGIVFTEENVIREFENVNFRLDIPGFVNIEDFRNQISSGVFLKQGSLINGAFTLKNDSYYFQTGELRRIDEIPRKKK